MSDTIPQSVSNGCRKYVESRIIINKFNTFNNVKTSELIEALYSCPEDEIFIKADDGLLDDFTIEHVDEQFDGFDTVQPACLALRRKEADNAQ